MIKQTAYAESRGETIIRETLREAGLSIKDAGDYASLIIERLADNSTPIVLCSKV